MGSKKVFCALKFATILMGINLAVTSSAKADDLSTERALAVQILLKAASNAGSVALQNKFLQMSQILQSAPLNVPPDGSDFQNCDAGKLAYTAPTISNGIYICNLLQSQGSLYIAQVLIHESAHLAGYPNECDATTIEMAAMNASGVGLVMRNAYMDGCGL